MSHHGLLAIDPGPIDSAYAIVWPDGTISGHAKVSNDNMLSIIQQQSGSAEYPVHIVCEMIASYGMPVGAEVFETCVWIGRFMQATGITVGFSRLYRKDVKSHLCHSMKANDAAIRCALIDRFGPGKEKAIGTKKSPGPLYGIKADVWAALAVAVTWKDTHP